jgi:flagellar assembly protein FliH
VQAGITQARNEIEQSQAATLIAIREQIEELASTNTEVMAEIRQEATELAHAVAAKLAPALIAREPLAEVEALISECLTDLREEPRVVVRASEQVVSGLKDRINTIAAQCGFPGHVVMLPDDQLQGADCRVEWADGGAERNREELDAHVERVVRQFVNRRRTEERSEDSAESHVETDQHTDAADAIGEPNG